MEVKCAEALKQLCQTKASITQQMDSIKQTIRGEGKETAEVGKTAKVTLTTKVTNNKTTRLWGMARRVDVPRLGSRLSSSTIERSATPLRRVRNRVCCHQVV